MFLATVFDGEMIMCLAKILNGAVEVVLCEVSPNDGITLQGWDRSTGGVIVVNFPKKELKPFNCPARELFQFRVDLLNRILRVPFATDKVEIRKEEGKEDQIRFDIFRREKMSGSNEAMTATMYLCEEQNEDRGWITRETFLEFRHLASMRMVAKRFHEILSYIGNLDKEKESVKISIEGCGRATFTSCVGMARGRYVLEEAENNNSKDSEVGISGPENSVSQVFPLRQLEKLAKVHTVAEEVSISMGGQFEGQGQDQGQEKHLLPMLVEWKLHCSTTLCYYLGQKIE